MNKQLNFVHKVNKESDINLTPALVGLHGTGKTSRVRKYAQEQGKAFEVVLLSSMLPEDVLGIPRVDEGVTRRSIPDWAERAIEAPTVLFFDELDKAHEDVSAVVLTLLCDRAIHGKALHPETEIIVAMQPVDPQAWLASNTGLALSTRLVYFPIRADWSYLEDKYGLSLHELYGLGSHDLKLPIVETPEPRRVDWCLQAIMVNRKERVFEDDDAMIGFLSNVVGSGVAERVVMSAKEAIVLTPESIVEALNDDPKKVYSLEIEEVIALSPTLFRNGTKEALIEAVYYIHSRSNNAREEYKAFVRAFVESVEPGSYVEIRLTEEEWNDFVDTTAKRLAAYYLQKANRLNDIENLGLQQYVEANDV
jgi:hypothetical protein